MSFKKYFCRGSICYTQMNLFDLNKNALHLIKNHYLFVCTLIINLDHIL